MSGPWPALPPGWGSDPAAVRTYEKLVLAAEVDVAKAAAMSPPTPPPSLADDESEKKLHENLATLVAGSVERARDGAKFVETAAAALGTIYTGILAFSFAAKDSPLPARGLYAAILLGIAIVGAAFYLAFVQRIPPIGRVDYSGSRPEDQWRRTEYLGVWTGAVVHTRSWALRTAVFALAFGVGFMPVAFLPDQVGSAAGGGTPSAVASPQPTPTWPPPPTGIRNLELAKVLYKAQLDQHAKTIASAPATAPSTGSSTDAMAFFVFVLALVVLGTVAATGADKRPAGGGAGGTARTARALRPRSRAPRLRTRSSRALRLRAARTPTARNPAAPVGAATGVAVHADWAASAATSRTL